MDGPRNNDVNVRIFSDNFHNNFNFNDSISLDIIMAIEMVKFRSLKKTYFKVFIFLFEYSNESDASLYGSVEISVQEALRTFAIYFTNLFVHRNLSRIPV